MLLLNNKKFISVRRCLPPSLKGKYLKYTPLPDYLLGSQVHVSCDGGFQIDGATTMTCTEEQTDNGNTMYWDIGNISYPYCKRMYTILLILSVVFLFTFVLYIIKNQLNVK